MIFQPYEIAIIAAFLFFLFLSFGAFCRWWGYRCGIDAMRGVLEYQRQKQREHEEIKRVWFQK